jgi:hypothetical protein
VSFWVITVDRATGAATSEHWYNRDDAWQRSIDLTKPGTYTTVVTATTTEGNT